MSAPIILYSTNTWLAYNIAEQFYAAEHYVWCTPYFSPRSAPPFASVPPTSCPLAIYRSLSIEVRAGDRHSAKIRDNRVGIATGARAKRAEGTIDRHQEDEILRILENAQVQDFRPLLYVIPHGLVGDLLAPVAVVERAHPLSTEFLIGRLPRRCFDVIDLDE
jgi:hypothetical protein